MNEIQTTYKYNKYIDKYTHEKWTNEQKKKTLFDVPRDIYNNKKKENRAEKTTQKKTWNSRYTINV